MLSAVLSSPPGTFLAGRTVVARAVVSRPVERAATRVRRGGFVSEQQSMGRSRWGGVRSSSVFPARDPEIDNGPRLNIPIIDVTCYTDICLYAAAVMRYRVFQLFLFISFPSPTPPPPPPRSRNIPRLHVLAHPRSPLPPPRECLRGGLARGSALDHNII